jgi:hypothetical protein
MKHPATRELYDYWDRQRDGAPAPERGAMEPGAVRHLIGDMFVVGCDEPQRFPFRVVGTRVCAMAGRDLKGEDFLELFAEASRYKIAEFLSLATDESLVTVAGVTAFTESRSAVPAELLLLPFAPSVLSPQSVTGLLVTLGVAADAGPSVLRDFSLVSWRHAGQQTLRQRAVRRLALAKGLVAYEGLREER